MTTIEAQTIAAEAVKELITLNYSHTERWQRMLGERIPPAARRECERRELLLKVVEVLEEKVK